MTSALRAAYPPGTMPKRDEIMASPRPAASPSAPGRAYLRYGHATHQGLVRADNQDAYGIFPREHADPTRGAGLLFVVADGMGGHQGGREASQMAVHQIEERYRASALRDVAQALRQAFTDANAEIYTRSTQDPALQGMGTTCTALVFRRNRAWIAHVGDSRAYRITEEGIEQLTQDHSRVEEMVRQQLLTPSEAATHPQRNVLSRALGVVPEVEIDLIEAPALETGHTFLLCSDGLADVPVEALHEAVRTLSPQQACDALVQQANALGGHDNVTVVVVRVEQVPRPATYRWGAFFIVLAIVLMALLLMGACGGPPAQ